MNSIKAPRSIRIAIQLIVLEIVAVIVSVALAYTAYYIDGIVPQTYYPFTPLNMLIDVIAYFAVMGISIYYILIGKNWARALYTIYAILHALVNIYQHTLWGATVATDLFVFLYLLIRVLSITLLFTPKSNLWFRTQH